MKPNWPVKKLGEVTEIYQPKTITSKEILEEGPYKVFGANGVIGYYDQYNHEDPEVIVTCRGATCGTINYSEPQSWITGNAMVVHPKDETLLKDFLYYSLKSQGLITTISGTAQPQITRSSLAPFQIAIPPTDFQKIIVERLDAIRKAQELNDLQISKTEELVESLIYTEIERASSKAIKLGEVCTFEGGTQPPKSTFVYEPKEGFIRLLQIRDYKSGKDAVYIPKTERHKTCSEMDIMIGRYGPPVFQILRGKSGAYNVALMKCVPNSKLLSNDWLYYFLRSKPVQSRIISLSMRARQAGVRPSDLNKLEIPLPDLKGQRKILGKITAVEDYKKLLLKQKSLLKELFDSVLDKCMKGEL